MLFCGQCGLKLNSGDKQCSRCGTPIDPGAPVEDDAQADAPTVASPSLLGHLQTQAPVNSDHGADQQKLVLHPDQDAGNSNYGTQAAYEATKRMEVSDQAYGLTPGVPSGPSRPVDFQTQYPQNRGTYPPQDMYAEYPQSGSNYVPPYPGQPGYQPYPIQGRSTSTNGRGRNAALLIILLGLLFILIAMTLFILERNNIFGYTQYYVVGSQNGFWQLL